MPHDPGTRRGDVSETGHMKLTDLTTAHKNHRIRIPGLDLEGVLTDFRTETIRDERSSFAGAGTQYHDETYVDVCLDGEWLPRRKGRLVNVEIID